MAKKQQSYDDALASLEALQQQMENNEIPMDELATKVATAAELLKYCQEQLRKTSEQIEDILSEKN